MQAVGVFVPQLLQQRRTDSLRRTDGIQQTGDVPHVADLQHGGHLQRRQTLQRQPHHLRLLGVIHRAHALQTHLVDGLEGVALPAGPADLFIIIITLALAGRGLGVLRNGQRHIRLDGPQLAVQIGEGHHLRVR